MEGTRHQTARHAVEVKRTIANYGTTMVCCRYVRLIEPVAGVWHRNRTHETHGSSGFLTKAAGAHGPARPRCNKERKNNPEIRFEKTAGTTLRTT